MVCNEQDQILDTWKWLDWNTSDSKRLMNHTIEHVLLLFLKNLVTSSSCNSTHVKKEDKFKI